MKPCSACNITKELSEFHKNRKSVDGVRAQCKDCHRAYMRKYGSVPYVKEQARARAKAWRSEMIRCDPDFLEKEKARDAGRVAAARKYMAEIKSKPCMDCGICYPTDKMQFDHRDPSQKKFELGRGTARGYSKNTLDAEMAKCDLVCFWCHVKREKARRLALRSQKKVEP